MGDRFARLVFMAFDGFVVGQGPVPPVEAVAGLLCDLLLGSGPAGPATSPAAPAKGARPDGSPPEAGGQGPVYWQQVLVGVVFILAATLNAPRAGARR